MEGLVWGPGKYRLLLMFVRQGHGFLQCLFINETSLIFQKVKAVMLESHHNIGSKIRMQSSPTLKCV